MLHRGGFFVRLLGTPTTTPRRPRYRSPVPSGIRDVSTTSTSMPSASSPLRPFRALAASSRSIVPTNASNALIRSRNAARSRLAPSR